MSTVTDHCNIHEIHTHHQTSLINRVWSRLTNAAHNHEITSDTGIKQQILRDQQSLELQNQSRRSADIHRMIMRNVF